MDKQFLVGADLLVTPVLLPNVSSVEGTMLLLPLNSSDYYQVSSLDEAKSPGEISIHMPQSMPQTALSLYLLRSGTSMFMSGEVLPFFYTRVQLILPPKLEQVHFRF